MSNSRSLCGLIKARQVANTSEKILHFGEKIDSFNNFHKLIDFIVDQASSILESERCSLMLLDEEKGEMCIRGAVGLAG